MVARKPSKEGFVPRKIMFVMGSPPVSVCMSAMNIPCCLPISPMAGAGEKLSQRMLWATPATMKRLIPLPIPQPFCTSSSRRITTIPAARSWRNTVIAVVVGRAPYIPPIMYAVAWTPVSIMENALLADVKRARSSGFVMSHAIMPAPTRSCRISPPVTMGPIPSSMSVPLLEANITLR